jgi:cephalosporin hydroxylase
MSPSVFVKSAAIRVLPAGMRRWIRGVMWSQLGMQQSAARPLDVSRLALVRDASLAELRDADFLEHRLIPALGLNDEGFEQIPAELHRHCGAGLRCWQYPSQLAGYLVLLSRLGIRSYLEIGVRHGGTFVLTVEYLRRFHPLMEAVAVDLGDSASLREYAAATEGVRFLQADSHSADFRAFVASRAAFDLALIDGDHTAEGCWQDFELLREKAAVLAFHDIVSDAVPGVGEVWRRVRAECAETHEFHEFTAQYESLHRRTGKRFLGLGVAVPRGHPSHPSDPSHLP